MWPDEIQRPRSGARRRVKNKFIAKPLTAEQVKDMIQIPPPVK